MPGESHATTSRRGTIVASSCFVLLWILITVLSHGVSYSALPVSWQTGFGFVKDNDLMPTETWLFLHIISTIALVGFVFWKRDSILDRRNLLVVLAAATVMRLVAMVGEPIHESDFYRYIWDGKSALVGVNPYRLEPGALHLWENDVEESFPDPRTGVMWEARDFSPTEEEILTRLATLRDENPEWFSRVSHQAVPTIYPPVAQAVFAFSAATFGWSIIGLKLILFLFDFGTILVLIDILRRLNWSKWLALLYAWNPLVVKEFANSAHYDAVPVFFAIFALWIVIRFPDSWKRGLAVGSLVALGTLAKYFAILLLPVLLVPAFRPKSTLGERISLSFRHAPLWVGVAAFSLIVVAGFLPYVSWDDAGWSQIFRGLAIYREYWQYNPGLFALFREGLSAIGDPDSFRHAGWICGGLLILVVASESFSPTEKKEDMAVKCAVVVGALFVLNPNAFPWYFCWVVAFLAFQPRLSWLFLCTIWPVNYLDFKSAEAAPIAHASWAGFYLMSGVIWLVFGILWLIEYAGDKSRCQTA